MAKETVEIPMPGKIISVKVKVGDTVKENDELCILEAMKMENPIVSPVKGLILEIKVAPNQAVETGHIVAIIEC
jgi:biotin carboxyl carrier protein